MTDRDPLACAISWVARATVTLAVAAIFFRRCWQLAGTIVRTETQKEKPDAIDKP